nr:hypothetical protein [Tanacetum cinerariifolium]
MSYASSTVTYTSVYIDSELGRVFWGTDEELSDGAVMSFASSTVTYTSVYIDSEPGRVFWGTDEELSDGGWAYAFLQDKASLVRVPVANVTLSSLAYLLRENTNSFPLFATGVSLDLRFLLGLSVFAMVAASASRAVAIPSEINYQILLWIFVQDNISREVIMVGSTMTISLLYGGEYSQWRERFMNYLEEQTDGEAINNLIQNGDQPLPIIAQVSLVGNAQNAPPTLKDPKS